MSRHRTATLESSAEEPDEPSGLSARPAWTRPGRDEPGSGRPGGLARSREATESRSSRHNGRKGRNGRKGSLLRRNRVLFPAVGIAALVVVVVTVAAYLLGPAGSGASGLEKALNSLPHSNSIARLEAERQQLILLGAAAATLTKDAKPQLVDPAQVMAADGTTTGAPISSATGGTVPMLPAPDPGTAQEIAFKLLPSFGFNQTTQWSCLEPLWQRESGWVFDAENAVSGAYGIPQALPGSKMAVDGADWATDPTTQIKWGLGYITQTYGTPCVAWEHEEADGFY